MIDDIITIIIGVIFVILGLYAGLNTNYVRHLLCGACLSWIGAICVFFGLFATNNPTTAYYLEAEPLAYNYETNITYFTSAEGQYTAEGIYPENTYLLTMDDNRTSDKEDDVVLAIWEPSIVGVG